MSATFRDAVAAICGRLPGAELSDPWGGGHDCWKVGDKMFAMIGAVTPGVSLKCPDVETADLLRETGAGAKAPYLHRSWVLLPEETAPDDLRFRILRSYDTVRAGLPAGVRRALPPRPEV